MLRLTFFAAALAPLLSACASHDPGPSCPPSGPTFRLHLTADAGALPADTRIEVRYGAGVEEYPGGADKSVFCHDVPSDSGANTREEISCDLWTSGAADVTITGSGCCAIEQTLRAERDECGLELTEVSLELGPTSPECPP